MIDFIENNIVISSNENLNRYDLIIVGSDQVWNIDITGGFDAYYWGDMPSKKIVTYAASFNKDYIPNSYISEHYCPVKVD